MGNKEKENVGVSGRRKRVTTPRGVVHAGQQIVRVRHIDGTKKNRNGSGADAPRGQGCRRNRRRKQKKKKSYSCV